jgi:hypothetical protein
MGLNVQCHTPVTLPTKGDGVRKYTEGLMSPMPNPLLLTDCRIHHERVNELKIHDT